MNQSNNQETVLDHLLSLKEDVVELLEAHHLVPIQIGLRRFPLILEFRYNARSCFGGYCGICHFC